MKPFTPIASGRVDIANGSVHVIPFHGGSRHQLSSDCHCCPTLVLDDEREVIIHGSCEDAEG